MRKDVAFACEQFQVSERRACKLLGMDRGSYRYEPRPDRNGHLREALVALARQKPRYGYRRLHALLVRREHPASVMRIYRLYRAEGLAVRRLKRKRLSRVAVATHVVRIQPGMGVRFRLRHSGDRSRHSCFSGGGCLHQRKSFLRSRYEFIEPSGHAVAGRCDRTSGKTGSDSLRQRSGTDQPALLKLVRGTEDSADPHSARTADAERPRGEFQRPIAGRVLKRKLVSQSDGRSGEDQRLAR